MAGYGIHISLAETAKSWSVASLTVEPTACQISAFYSNNVARMDRKCHTHS